MTRSIVRPTDRRLGSLPHPSDFLRLVADDPAAPFIATVVGPGGIGKTATLDAIAHAYTRADVPVRWLRCGAPDRGDTAADGVVLVDDAQRLDAAAWRTVHAIAESPAARLVLGYRQWPRPRALQLVAARSRYTLVLAHLDRAGVAARITARFGAAAPDALVDLVHEQSGGLPLLVDVITQALREAGRYDQEHPQRFRRPDHVSVSPALAERMRRHVDGLEPAVQELLATLAVGARPDPDVLGALLGADSPAADPARLIDIVEAALATGLLTEDGALIPFMRGVVLRLMPALRVRELRRRLGEIELARGGSLLGVGRQLLDCGVTGTRMAAVFDAAAAEAVPESPALVARLLDAAVAAGARPDGVAGRRAHAAALGGELDLALRLADQVIGDPDAPHRERALAAAGCALSHRGLPGAAAELLRCLPPEQAVLAVPPLLGTGAVAEARAVLAAADRAAGPTPLLARAATLLARGVLGTVDGPVGPALSQLAQAATLVEPVAAQALLPDTPAALTAVLALQCGEYALAETALHRAAVGRHGGRAMQHRHRLLHAWVAMARGRPQRARQVLDTSAGRLEPRDELLATAVAIALARRDNDPATLAALCQRARAALVEHPVDLYSLPQLGECAVAAARVGGPDWLDPHLATAERLLDAVGRPPVWTATLHWYRLQAATAVDDAAAAAEQAAALTALAEAGTDAGPRAFRADLAAAARCWAQVLADEIETDAVQAAARRLHGAGLVWEATQLAGQAGQRATDRRTVLALQACARGLAGPAGEDAEPATEPGAAAPPAADPTPAGPPGEPAAGPATEPESPLSERELEIGSLVLAGLTYKQIGERLFISAKTVEHHVARIRGRLGVSSRNELFGRLRTLV